MRSSYTETYINLYHGTTEARANSILESQGFIPSKDGWCGSGVYFYDNKSKAWWSADRTCSEDRKKGVSDAKATVILVDICNLNRSFILDLRDPQSLEQFASFVDLFLKENEFEITDIENEFEAKEKKRAFLISFFCKKNNIKLVVGHFKQHPQPKIDSIKTFAGEWQLAIGIETIFCAKDATIIENIRRR